MKHTKNVYALIPESLDFFGIHKTSFVADYMEKSLINCLDWQYSMINYPLPTFYATNKYQILICLWLLLIDLHPLFSGNIELLFSCIIVDSWTAYPCASSKYHVPDIWEVTFSTPTLLSFDCLDFLCIFLIDRTLNRWHGGKFMYLNSCMHCKWSVVPPLDYMHIICLQGQQ